MVGRTSRGRCASLSCSKLAPAPVHLRGLQCGMTRTPSRCMLITIDSIAVPALPLLILIGYCGLDLTAGEISAQSGNGDELSQQLVLVALGAGERWLEVLYYDMPGGREEKGSVLTLRHTGK
eukprot:1236707-Rhodomonas_salina.3